MTLADLKALWPLIQWCTAAVQQQHGQRESWHAAAVQRRHRHQFLRECARHYLVAAARTTQHERAQFAECVLSAIHEHVVRNRYANTIVCVVCVCADMHTQNHMRNLSI